ncbi:MAG: Unknown protein [uncultured Sulfurovum sp.]|uniref:Uncharacterized protein n=1 Tax=uncultured Sulfurovum sp. TaxID=269237 RepID=A0A6S6TKH0_9BACT|nr:MAG: Unknown protein [uncultured Sulfurovum sp.]
MRGLEPPRRKAPDPKSGMLTNYKYIQIPIKPLYIGTI